MKMTVLCWMTVTLALVLSAGHSQAIDQNQLAGIMRQILNRFRPSYMFNGVQREPMFSLAVSIPFNSKSKRYEMSQVPDNGDDVRTVIVGCDVYTSQTMVAATVLRWPNVLDQCPDGRVQWTDVLRNCKGVKTWADVKRLANIRGCSSAVWEGRADHAEFRTLQKLPQLMANKDDLLVFYVLSSPCDQKCTNEQNRFNILDMIRNITRWTNYAVVFSNVFQPRTGPSIPTANLRGALERLGAKVGLNNIYRCNGKPLQCTSCSSRGQVSPGCYSN